MQLSDFSTDSVRKWHDGVSEAGGYRLSLGFAEGEDVTLAVWMGCIQTVVLNTAEMELF